MERKHKPNPQLSTIVSAVPRRSCQAPIHLHSTWSPAAGMAHSSKKKKQTTFFCLKPENKKSSATWCHFTLIWRSQYAGLALQFLPFCLAPSVAVAIVPLDQSNLFFCVSSWKERSSCFAEWRSYQLNTLNGPP